MPPVCTCNVYRRCGGGARKGFRPGEIDAFYFLPGPRPPPPLPNAHAKLSRLGPVNAWSVRVGGGWGEGVAVGRRRGVGGRNGVQMATVRHIHLPFSKKVRRPGPTTGGGYEAADKKGTPSAAGGGERRRRTVGLWNSIKTLNGWQKAVPRALVIFNAAGPPYAENYPEGKTPSLHPRTHTHTHSYTTRAQHVVGRGVIGKRNVRTRGGQIITAR